MIHPDDWDELVESVAKLNGLDLGAAGEAVASVGDTPCIDAESGLILADLPDGRILKLRWPEDDEG